jgi:hypothetical protein
MHQIISLILAVLGFVLFFAPDYILDKSVQNSSLQTIREYHQIVGAGLIAAGYYVYTLQEQKTQIQGAETSVASEPTTPSTPTPPSYEEATSE